jgi:hypothetical protein
LEYEQHHLNDTAPALKTLVVMKFSKCIYIKSIDSDVETVFRVTYDGLSGVNISGILLIWL